MSFDHTDYGQQHGIEMTGQKPSKPSSKRKNVVIDDHHPFDLDTYISPYSGVDESIIVKLKPSLILSGAGRAAIRRLRFIADECEQLAPRALQLAIQLLTQTRDVVTYQSTVQDYNARSGMRDVIPVDTEWVEITANRNNRERDQLETELKTYSSNMIKESIRVSLQPPLLTNFPHAAR